MLKDNLKTLRKNKGLSQEELSIKSFPYTDVNVKVGLTFFSDSKLFVEYPKILLLVSSRIIKPNAYPKLLLRSAVLPIKVMLSITIESVKVELLGLMLNSSDDKLR